MRWILWSATIALLHLATGCHTTVDMPPLLENQCVRGTTSGRAAGPLAEWHDDALNHSVTAAPRPFYSHYTDPSSMTSGWDFLWPLASGRQRTGNQRILALPWVYTREQRQGFDSVRRWLLPVVYQGTGESGNPYLAVFPLGGRVEDVIGYDQMTFAAFPLYLKTARGESTAQSVLWPIFSRAHGPDWQSARIFPLYGQRNDLNGKQQFFLWPLVHTRKKTLPDLTTEHGFFLFPLYGNRTVRDSTPAPPKARAWTVLWPFFSSAVEPEGQRLHCPWPFYQRTTSNQAGHTVDKLWLWPLWGYSRRNDETYRFMLWPVAQNWHLQSPGQDVRMSWLVPFYWQADKQRIGTEPVSTRHLWPLARYERRGDHQRLWLLALWPQPNVPPIERNYAPLWRVARWEKTAAESRHELLWGLWRYRHHQDDGTHLSLFPLADAHYSSQGFHLSLLKGFADIGRTNGQRQARFLWLLRY